MSLFVVRYDYRDGSEATRDERRPEHRAWLAQQSSLRISGPTDDVGAILIFEAADASALGGLLDHDPFAVAGTIERRVISGWTPVSGSWREPLDL